MDTTLIKYQKSKPYSILLPANNSEENKEHEIIRGDVLEAALQKFDIIGQTGKELLIKDLKTRGYILDGNHSYPLKEIRLSFSQLFGEDASLLIIERIKKILGDFGTLAWVALPTLQFGAICLTSSCICFICNCLGMGMSAAPATDQMAMPM